MLQQALCRCIVRTDASRLPTAVVTTGIALVQLELALGIPTSVDEGDTKRPETAVLRVALLEVAQAADELLAGDVFVVGQEVTLGGLTGVVDEDVGVGRHPCYGTDHIAGDLLVVGWRGGLRRVRNALVENVQLLGRCVLL